MVNLYDVIFKGLFGHSLGLRFGGDDDDDGGGQVGAPQPITWPGETELRDQVLAYSKKYGDANANLGNLTPQEQKALELLGVYGGTKAGSAPTSSAARNEILKTLGGHYDPVNSPYYKPLIEGIDQRKERSIANLRRGSQLGGNLSSLARARSEGETSTLYDAEMANLMLGLQERERGRQMSVLPQALQAGQYDEEGPLRQAQAYRSVGSIPRDLETNALNMAQGTLTGYSPTYYFPHNQPLGQASGGRNRWGDAASGAVSGATVGAAGGPWGMAGGAVAGGLLGYFG